MSSSYSSLDSFVSHWTHFTVCSVYVFAFCVSFILNLCHVVTWWGGLGVIGA